MKKPHKKRASLKNDLAFKLAFANEDHPNILLGLIETITGEQHESIEILTPYDIQVFNDFINETQVQNQFYFTENDIQARVDGQMYYIVEMQRQNHAYLGDRCVFYISQKFVAQRERFLKSGARYMQLDPVHLILIADFNLLPADGPAVQTVDLPPQDSNYWFSPIGHYFASITTFCLTNSNDLTLHQQQLQDLFNDKPIQGEQVPFMKQAQEITNLEAMTPHQRRVYDMIEESRKLTEFIKAAEFTEGWNEGKEKGREEGIEQGIHTTQQTTVANMMRNGFNDEQIIMATGLDLPTIQSMKLMVSEEVAPYHISDKKEE